MAHSLLVTKSSPPSGGAQKNASMECGICRVFMSAFWASELELIQTQMAQKPMLRAEVYAHAMRASQNRKKEVRREKEV